MLLAATLLVITQVNTTTTDESEVPVWQIAAGSGGGALAVLLGLYAYCRRSSSSASTDATPTNPPVALQQILSSLPNTASSVSSIGTAGSAKKLERGAKTATVGMGGPKGSFQPTLKEPTPDPVTLTLTETMKKKVGQAGSAVVNKNKR